MHWPHANYLQYKKRLYAIADECFRAMLSVYLPALPTLSGLSEGKGQIHLDSIVADVNLMSKVATRSVFRAFPDELLEKLATDNADEISDAHRRELTQKLAQAASVDISIFGHREPEVDRIKKDFVKENVDLIKTIPTDYFERIGKQVNEAVTSGKRVEELSAELRQSYNLSRARANLIARDQTTKLYGELNEARQESLGVSKYIWRTMGDERVREEHAIMEGQEISWDDPQCQGVMGDLVHPGEDIQCRCTAEPVLPEVFESRQETEERQKILDYPPVNKTEEITGGIEWAEPGDADAVDTGIGAPVSKGLTRITVEKFKEAYQRGPLFMVTAANPESTTITPLENDARMQALKNELVHLGAVFHQGYGYWEGNPEPTFIVHPSSKITKQVIAKLGEKYSQTAVTYYDPKETAFHNTFGKGVGEPDFKVKGFLSEPDINQPHTRIPGIGAFKAGQD